VYNKYILLYIILHYNIIIESLENEKRYTKEEHEIRRFQILKEILNSKVTVEFRTDGTFNMGMF